MGIWVHNCNTKGTQAQEWLPLEGGRGQVVDFRGRPNPDRAKLIEDLNDPATTAEGRTTIRSTLGELDAREALSQVFGKEVTNLPTATKDDPVLALKNRLGKLEHPAKPWDFDANKTIGNPDLMGEGPPVMDVYTPAAEINWNTVQRVLDRKSAEQASAILVRLMPDVPPEVGVREIIRAAETAHVPRGPDGKPNGPRELPPGLRDLYTLDQNGRVFHVEIPWTPVNKPGYGQIDLSTGNTYRLDTPPPPGRPS